MESPPASDVQNDCLSCPSSSADLLPGKAAILARRVATGAAAMMLLGAQCKTPERQGIDPESFGLFAGFCFDLNAEGTQSFDDLTRTGGGSTVGISFHLLKSDGQVLLEAADSRWRVRGIPLPELGLSLNAYVKPDDVSGSLDDRANPEVRLQHLSNVALPGTPLESLIQIDGTLEVTNFSQEGPFLAATRRYRLEITNTETPRFDPDDPAFPNNQADADERLDNFDGGPLVWVEGFAVWPSGAQRYDFRTEFELDTWLGEYCRQYLTGILNPDYLGEGQEEQPSPIRELTR